MNTGMVEVPLEEIEAGDWLQRVQPAKGPGASGQRIPNSLHPPEYVVSAGPRRLIVEVLYSFGTERRYRARENVLLLRRQWRAWRKAAT